MTATDQLWISRWSDVLAYRQQNGHWPGHSAANDPEVASLAAWMAAQRARRRRGVLKADREARMLAAGFDFDPPRRGRKKRHPPDLVAAIVDGYHRGATVWQIARLHSIRASTVTRILNEVGVRIRPRIETATLVEMRDRGLSHNNIADQVGLKPNTVTVRLRRAQRG